MTLLILGLTRASGFFAGTEPENGTLSGNASVVVDATASGGKVIEFNAPSPSPSPSPSPTPPPPSGCAAGVTGSSPACTLLPPAPVVSGEHWNVSFSEEFNGSDYDHSKLTPCFDWNSGGCTSSFNQGLEHYDPGQIQVSNGTAKLIAAPHSPAFSNSACLNGSCSYYAGLLSTARPLSSSSNYLYKFTYGYVESRFKLPVETLPLKTAPVQGMFTAFWMLPADPTYNYQTEIDILENLGYDPSQMWMTYSYGKDRSLSYEPNTGIGNNGACAYKNYTKDYNDGNGGYVRMGLDWEPNHIAWYINGQKCGEFTDASQIGSAPMQLILNMMVSNSWERSWNEGIVGTPTVQLEADYIRVYQQVPN